MSIAVRSSFLSAHNSSSSSFAPHAPLNRWPATAPAKQRSNPMSSNGPLAADVFRTHPNPEGPLSACAAYYSQPYFQGDDFTGAASVIDDPPAYQMTSGSILTVVPARHIESWRSFWRSNAKPDDEMPPNRDASVGRRDMHQGPPCVCSTNLQLLRAAARLIDGSLRP